MHLNLKQTALSRQKTIMAGNVDHDVLVLKCFGGGGGGEEGYKIEAVHLLFISVYPSVC